jgi:hypothetical protein
MLWLVFYPSQKNQSVASLVVVVGVSFGNSIVDVDSLEILKFTLVLVYQSNEQCVSCFCFGQIHNKVHQQSNICNNKGSSYGLG